MLEFVGGNLLVEYFGWKVLIETSGGNFMVENIWWKCPSLKSPKIWDFGTSSRWRCSEIVIHLYLQRLHWLIFPKTFPFLHIVDMSTFSQVIFQAVCKNVNGANSAILGLNLLHVTMHTPWDIIHIIHISYSLFSYSANVHADTWCDQYSKGFFFPMFPIDIHIRMGELSLETAEK